MIKNVIFDLGNVLLTFRPKDFLLKFTDDIDRIDGFVSKVTSSKTWLRLDRGTISIQEARAIFLKEHPEVEDLLNIFFNRWKEMFAPIQNNIEILKRLKDNGYKTYALSNFIKEAFEFVYSKFEFLKLFDGMILSYREKVIKPEKAIYEILLQRYNLIPKECLFIDDTEIFVLGAQKLGIPFILFNLDLDLRIVFKKFKINI